MKGNIEFNEADLDRWVTDKAELMLLRMQATGNPHQSVLLIPAQHHYPQPTQHYQPPALPAPPPALPPATVIQDATLIQPPIVTQAVTLPQQPIIQRRLPQLSQKQRRAIAIIGGIAVALWAMDAIIPGLPGVVIDRAAALWKDAPTMPTTASEETATKEETEAPTEGQPEELIEVDPTTAERIRQVLPKPAAPME